MGHGKSENYPGETIIRINIVALGKGETTWQSLTAEYVKRMPKTCSIDLIEINPYLRSSSINREKIAKIETEKLLAAVPKNSLVIALDEEGKEFNTMELAQKISQWHGENQDISLLIGGANGLDKKLIKSLFPVWSLSKLTLPHQMVRTLIVEQIYRAWTIIREHPYHRS